MKPKMVITEKDLNKSTDVLSMILSDEMTLNVKTKKNQGHISGDSFMELHKLFQSQYNELEEVIDEITARINIVGSYTKDTLKEGEEQTRPTESPNIYPVQKDMSKELLNNRESVIIELREDIETCMEQSKDSGTTDFLTGIMQQHETIALKMRQYFGS